MPPDLPALAARLREPSATGAPDVLLELCRTFAGHDNVRLWRFDLGGDPRSSIDAAVALVRMTMPGVRLDIYCGDEWANVQLRHGGLIGGTAAARTASLAICLALVEWRIAHGG